MDFFTQAKKTVTKTAGKVAKVTGEVVDITKLNLTIAGLQSDISDQYEVIGKTVYEARKGGNADEGAVEDACVRLDDLLDKLRQNRAKLREVRKIQVCPHCQEETSDSSRFCPSCGAPMKDAAAE